MCVCGVFEGSAQDVYKKQLNITRICHLRIHDI